jgi:hypothetical protein
MRPLLALRDLGRSRWAELAETMRLHSEWPSAYVVVPHGVMQVDSVERSEPDRPKRPIGFRLR